MRTILGLNYGAHDGAAALLVDGRLVAAVEEERLTRQKHARWTFPELAAAACLDIAGLRRDELDCVAFSFDPRAGMRHSLWHAMRSGGRFALAEIRRRQPMVTAGAFARWLLKLPARTPVRFVVHHDAHAASAFFASSFDEAAILVADGVGEWTSTSLYLARGNRLELLLSIPFPHSLGFAYASFTEYLGFEPLDGEWKVMGLAPYGAPDFLRELRDILRVGADGRYELDLGCFRFQHDWAKEGWYTPRLVEMLGPSRLPESEIGDRHKAIAASVQARLEEVVFHLVDHLHRRTGVANLCIAGGVAQNSSMNGKLARRGPFSRVFVQPAADDAGSALGAALHVLHVEAGRPRELTLRDVALGPEFGDAAIAAALRDYKLRFEEVPDRAAAAARLVASGKIVGWFQGRMEFGPRALGRRSILADPRRAEMKDRINRAVKYREPFRPFAPAVLAERAGVYFEDLSDAPFMTMVTDVRPAQRATLAAVTHVDGTARLQTVDRETNPPLASLLQHLDALTSVPVVLNTSFNLRGEPIVCTPRDALATYFASGMDALVIGGCVLEKSDGDGHARGPVV